MEKARLKLRKLIRELEQLRGRHTELISIYVPGNYDINKITELVSQEQALTRNVKSKTVRKNVLSALEKIAQELKLYNRISENGLVIFCGNVGTEEGKPDIKLWTIEPPEKINLKHYHCDQTFELGPLKEQIREKINYGIICLDKSSADIAVIKGKNIEILKHKDSLVPGKTRAGGQSAVRFYRVRENLLHDFLKSVGEAAKDLFGNEIKGIIISGPGPVKESLQKEDYLPNHIKKKIIGIVDTSYTEEPGVREALEKGKDLIKETELYKENELLEEFFTKLSKAKGEIVYGMEDTIDALRDGKAETVLVSEDIEEIDEIERLVEENNAKLEFISTTSPYGSQFKSIGGIGAILRY